MRKKELTCISLNVIRLDGMGRARPFSSRGTGGERRRLEHRDAMGRTELASEVAGGSIDGKLLHEEEAFVEAGDESVGCVGISVERSTDARRFRTEESRDGAIEVGAVKIFGVDDKILDENRHSVVHEQSRGEEGDGEGEGLKPEPSGGGADNGPMDTCPDGLAASAGGVEEAEDDGGVNWLPSQVRDEHGRRLRRVSKSSQSEVVRSSKRAAAWRATWKWNRYSLWGGGRTRRVDKGRLTSRRMDPERVSLKWSMARPAGVTWMHRVTTMPASVRGVVPKLSYSSIA